MEVTLEQMLCARENRAMAQMGLIRDTGRPVISFSMNIPGPVKDSPLIRRGFRAGLRCLDHRLPRGAVLRRLVREAVTGCEALYAVDLEPRKIKAITTAIEDDHGLGRLFDMDVLDTDFQKLDRSLVGGGSRDCIVCGAPGRNCASRRLHTVAQLQEATRRILTDYFRREDGERIGSLAVQSLLDEVCTTPKPGLVDHRNRGSHRDMDLFTFIASASALSPYFRDCAAIGMEGGQPEETFAALRRAGLKAEETMFAATGGVNTHKGAVFTMGLLCGAAGRLWKPEGGFSAEALCREVSLMTARAMEADRQESADDTVGRKLYREHRIGGIREEAAGGLPSVLEVGLPAFEAHRALGQNDAGVYTLLELMARVEDTNMIARGGLSQAEEAREKVRTLLEAGVPDREQVQALDDWFIERNLSPGGCADLLAAVYFLSHLTEA